VPPRERREALDAAGGCPAGKRGVIGVVGHRTAPGVSRKRENEVGL